MKYSKTSTEKKFRPAALALAMSLTVVLTGCKSDQSLAISEPVIRPVFVEVVSNIDVADLSFNGTIHSASRADLSFKTGGRLVDMLVQEGDYVEQGQTVARLDSADAKIAHTSARIERDNARAEYQRAKKLYESRQSISKSQFEELTLRFHLAQNRFEEASRRLDDTNLIAPFSGVVSRTFVNNHVLVQSNQTIITLHDLNELEAVIHVPESVMMRNSTAEKVFAQATTAPYQIYNLTLKKFETEPDPVSGTYAITFNVENAETPQLLPGMNVQVYSSTVKSDSQSIQVPLTAVSPDNMGNQFVWVVDDENRLHKRNVFTGTLNGQRVEITSSLRKGEVVVVSGTQNLEEGLVVRPKTVEVY
ncbi:efflux RND transporter periplasmic adaptor subunit [Vibrio hepatarius]|uniref:efflux RND transporter periplasmic adaptor subunit n=1 Tax=Vibrio hepatarius TaxID=171383 RepID=UPI003736A0F3